MTVKEDILKPSILVPFEKNIEVFLRIKIRSK